MAVSIGRVVWPGPVGAGAGIIKGAAVFVDYGERADSVEVGSITKHLCKGNAGKTIWRFPEEKGLRHNAGLPNPGARGLVDQLKEAQYKIRVPWGLNVAVTPGTVDKEAAASDVANCLQAMISGGLKPDWVTFNASSPDTVDKVADLMEPTRVKVCLEKLRAVVAVDVIPVWLKLGVIEQEAKYKELAEMMVQIKVDGVVVANAMADPNGKPGGWCGEPLRARMLSLVWLMKELTGGVVPIIALGGIQKGTQLQEALEAGAVAAQVVSAFLFKGREAAITIKREYEILTAEAEANKTSLK